MRTSTRYLLAALLIALGLFLITVSRASDANAQYGPDYPIPATPVIVQEPNFTG
jgi:hypothetical protein